MSVFLIFLARALLLLAPLGLPAVASGVALNELSGSGLEQFRWSSTQAARLHGVPAHWREFTSPSSLLHATEALATHADRFQRVIAYKGGVLLTGVRANWHWVAEIQPDASGSRGRVSVLRIDEAQLRGLFQSRSSRNFAWLDHRALLRFSHESAAGGSRTTHEVYGASMSVDQITAYVQQNLRRTGWQPESRVAWWSGADAWRRGSSRLVVMLLPSKPGSTILLSHTE